jgi:hypothetical protein
MPLRLRFLAFVAMLLPALAVPCAAPAAVTRAATFVFSGGVAEPGGKPVRNAKVLLQGLVEPAALTDTGGRFSFSHVVPDLQALAAAPLRLVLRASHKGWNLALPTGESALAVELRIVRTADGSARLEVRSNDAGVAKTVAAAFIAPGDVTVALSGGFVRQLGAEDRSQPVLAALETVPVAPPAPATGVATVATAALRTDSTAVSITRPDSTKPTLPVAAPAPVPQLRPERPESMRLFPSAPAPGTTPGPAPAAPATPLPPDSLRIQGMAEAGIVAGSGPVASRSTGGPRLVPDTAATALRGIRVTVRPDTAASAPVSAGSGGGSALRVALGRALPDTQPAAAAGRACECRVRGTVEVSSDRSLRGALRVVVSIAELPARRDTVALFMGPPRPFDLGLVPCGGHRLEVRPLSARLFTVMPPALDAFDCSAGRTRQFRVVLKPR